MKSLPILTKQQSEKLISFYRSSTPGATMHLDASNTEHRAVIEIMLETAGRSRSKYPLLYKSLDTTGAYKGDPDIDKIHMVDAGQTNKGKAIARIWSRSTSDTMINGGNLMVFDTETGKLLAQGANSAIKKGFLDCPTRTDTAMPAGKKLSLLYVGHITDPNGVTRFFCYANTVVVATDEIQATISAPVIRMPPNTEITIAVGRNPTQPIVPNADYVYYEPGNTWQSNPYLITPFTGNVGLGGIIDLSRLTIANLTTSVFVTLSTSPCVEVTRDPQYTSDAAMCSALTSPLNSNLLQWDFPYDSLGHETTQSIVYNSISLGPTDATNQSCFYFAFNAIPILVNDQPSNAPSFFVCSTSTPGEGPSINCTVIPNMTFWCHCIARGTLVTLEDGTQKPIEEINEKNRVKTGIKDGSLAVWGTVFGKHSSNSLAQCDEVYKLTAANGKTVTATRNHAIFLTGDKCRMICDIVPGDTVITDEGMSTVHTNEMIQCEDVFFGLGLGNAEEKESPDFPYNMANFYAGGILCGDHQATGYNSRNAYEDLDYALPRMKQELHTDYTSALADKRF